MKQKKLLLILFYALLILLPSAVFIQTALGNGTNTTYIASGILGITSYVLLNFELLLVSRNKFLDKHFGLDKLYRFHMYIAVAAIALAYIHKMIKESIYQENFQTSLGDNALTVFIATGIFSMLFMINKLFFKIKQLDQLKAGLKRIFRFNHQSRVLIHNIMVVGLIFLVAHILLAFSVKSNLPLMLILVAYFVVPLILYLERKVYRVYFSKSRKYVVSEVINEAEGILTIRFKPKYGKMLEYAPGQFIYVRIKNPGLPGDEHPFTISSSPTNKDYLSITVKQLGDFTKKLVNVKPGDAAYIDGSYGTFSYVMKPAGRKLCFIAGGIGITPFLGMLRHMNIHQQDADVKLLWGARNIPELICLKELSKIYDRIKAFDLIPVISNDPEYVGEKGYINTTLLKKYVDELHEYDFYICGPPIMLEQQLKNLKELGVSGSNIHYERFAI